jgi:plasmid stabilization system protein ParE
MEQVTYHPGALAELHEAMAWYENEHAGLGERFHDAVEQTVLDLIHYPVAWAPVHGIWRRALVKGFPYGVIYRKDDEGVYISAVMHLHRRPDYWRNRE